MNFTKKAGFTLIELLVVITIIGILATGGVAVYTSQIQKARDTTRISDIETIRSGVEQFYQDASSYPNTTDTDLTSSGGILKYISKLPRDPKSGEPCAYTTGTAPMCGYAYMVADDDNGLALGAYEISTAFENKGNIDSKAAKDKVGNGNYDPNRWEVGIPTKTGIDTEVDNDAALPCKNKFGTFQTSGKKCTNTAVNSTVATAPVIFAGN